MRKIIYLIGAFLICFSCQEDVEIGDPLEIIEDYQLPQSGASDEANNRILKIYEDYGSYVLYDYTQTDALWQQAAGVAANQVYVVKMGDATYVEDMLDYVQDVWFQFFPNEFLKKGGLPYRVFLADSVYQIRTNGRYIMYNQMINGNAIVIAGMNKDLKTMTAATKRSRSLELINTLWNYYIAEGLLDVPEKFYDGTDYSTMPEIPLSDSTNLEAYRKRGFLPSGYSGSGKPSEWFYSSKWGTSWTSAKTNDLNSYMYNIMQRTDEQMAEYLNNPDYELIRTKWNILVNYYKDEYNIDLRKIAHVTY